MLIPWRVYRIKYDTLDHWRFPYTNDKPPLKSSEPFLCLVNRDENTTRFEQTLLEIHHWHHCVGQNHPKQKCMNWLQTNFSFLDPWSWTWTKTIKTMQVLANIQGTCCMAVSTTSWSLRISNGALCNKALLLRTLPSLASEGIASLCSLYTYQFKVRSKYDKIGTKTKQQLILNFFTCKPYIIPLDGLKIIIKPWPTMINMLSWIFYLNVRSHTWCRPISPRMSKEPLESLFRVGDA